VVDGAGVDLALKEEDQEFASSFRSWLGEHLRRPPAFADLADEVAWVPMIIFNMNQPGNIKRVVLGEKVGSLVTA
jgi:hypothetical protein